MKYIVRKNKPTIDICLLTYNNLFNTKICIKHLYEYTSNFGLIIVDNGSTDETPDYLVKLSQKHNNITLSLEKENLGIINGRNYAYDLSKLTEDLTEYICFIDNDQFVENGWLESYLGFIKRGYDVVGAEGWKMKDNFNPYKKIISKEEEYNYVGCGGMVLKREVIEDVGLFDPDFNPMYFEDPDFNFRAYDKGYKIGWDTEKKVIHKHHKLLGNGDRFFYFKRNLVRFREKWGERKPPVLKME